MILKTDISRNLFDDGFEYVGVKIGKTGETILLLEHVAEGNGIEIGNLNLFYPIFLSFYFGNHQALDLIISKGSEWNSIDARNPGLQKATSLAKRLTNIQMETGIEIDNNKPADWYRFIDHNETEICFLSIYEPKFEVLTNAH